jgi:hypothetical protein
LQAESRKLINHKNKNFATWDKGLDTKTQKLKLSGGQVYGFSIHMFIYIIWYTDIIVIS